jgi:hypothetical protein
MNKLIDNPQSILIEGVDRAGKSTLTKALKNTLGWDSLTLTHRNGDQYERYVRAYNFAQQCVIERGHLSELVYSQMLRGITSFNAQQLQDLDVWLTKSIIIWANPEWELCELRYKSDPLPAVISLEQVKIAWDGYKEFFENHQYPNLYNYSSAEWNDVDKCCEWVHSRAQKLGWDSKVTFHG